MPDPNGTRRSQEIRVMAWEWVKKFHPKIAEKMIAEVERRWPRRPTKRAGQHIEFISKIGDGK